MVTISIRDDLPLTGEKFTPGMAWIDLQILAENGRISTSFQALSKRWKWSVHRVIRFIEDSAKKELLELCRSTFKGTITTQTIIIKSDSYKDSDTIAERSAAQSHETIQSSRVRVIDDSLSNEIDYLFNIPPTHKQESKDSVCSAPTKSKPNREPFIPPTIEQVAEYCREKNLTMDPGEFVDHFTSNGWLVSGRAKMKDWKAAARNWARNEIRFRHIPGTGQQSARLPEQKKIMTLEELKAKDAQEREIARQRSEEARKANGTR